MPTYTITATDGKEYDVDAPDEQTATSEFTRQWPGINANAGPEPQGSLGQRTLSALGHPLQSAQDLLRTTSNFITFGGRDAIAPYLGSGRTREQENLATDYASRRLGTWDEAADLGLAAAQPSMAAKALPESAGALKAAGTYATEGGLYGATNSLLHGQNPWIGAATGAVTGGTGSLAAPAFGRVFGDQVPNPAAGEQNWLSKTGEFAAPWSLTGGDLVKRAPTIAATEFALSHLGIPPAVTTTTATGLNLLGKTPLGRQSSMMTNPDAAGAARDMLARMTAGYSRTP